MDTFTLTITLGNEAMQNYGDISGLLKELAADLHKRYELTGAIRHVTSGKCRDANGNTVAQWEVK